MFKGITYLEMEYIFNIPGLSKYYTITPLIQYKLALLYRNTHTPYFKISLIIIVKKVYTKLLVTIAIAI